jgi:outer membrane immunogenic protein
MTGGMAMKTYLLTAVALTALLGSSLGGSAIAADMPVKARPLPPPPVFSWTGFYFGGHGGCAYDRKDIVQGPFTDADPGGAAFVTPTAHGGGCYGGVQVGYNYQVGSWVWGIEADGSWGKIRSSTQLLELEPNETELVALYEQELKSFGTVRGRLGWTWNWGTTPVLWYATGGWAWARSQLTTTPADNIAGVLPFAISDTQTHRGWTVGTGLEVALDPNWSFKGEYLYMNLGSKTYATALITDDGALPGSNFANVDLKIHTVRIGLNYHFGWLGKGPVAARY